MNIVQYFIPGKFDDAYLYSGNLFCITDQKELQIVSLNHVTDVVNDRSTDAFPLLEFLLSRNVWFHYESFGQSLRTPEIFSAYQQLLDKLKDTPREIPLDKLTLQKYSIIDPGDFVLDINIYNNRVYLSSTKRLQSSDFEVTAGDIAFYSPFSNRYTAACYMSKVFMGALHSSLGTNGLQTCFAEFTNDHKEKQTAETSVATSHVSTGFVNYETSNQAYMYRPLVGVGRPLTIREDMIDLLPSGYDVSPYINISTLDLESETIHTEQLGNRLYVVKEDGSIYLSELRLLSQNQTIGYKRRPKLIGELQESIIGISVVIGALIIETLDGVYVVSKEGKEKLINGTVMNVRTFPSSKQYRHISAIIAEDGLYLLSIIDLEMIRDRMNRKVSYKKMLREQEYRDWAYDLEDADNL